MALALPVIGSDAVLILTLILLGVQSLGGGFTGTAWQSMISKIMPAHILGSFFGLQSAAVNLFGAGGALLASVILERLAYPGSFVLLFAVAGVSLMISFLFLAQTFEPKSAPRDVVGGLSWRGFGSRLARDSARGPKLSLVPGRAQPDIAQSDRYFLLYNFRHSAL